MKKILSASIVFLYGVLLLGAMPPHPDVVQEYKDKGQLPLLSGRMAADRAAGRNVPQKVFPNSGTRKVLVLLAGFSDADLHDGTGIDGFEGSTPTFYDDLFTGTSSASMSWKKYYMDMSNGKLILDFDVYDAGQVSGSHNSYGANIGIEDADPQGFVTDAVNNLITDFDSTVDFSQYDNDGDGYIDTVIVIHQGPGEEISGETTDIWSHQWGITPVSTNDGVSFSNYAIQPEYVQTPGDSTIGVFVHEFAHVLGLPDLYDTSGASDGIGDWGVMAGGSWSGPDWKGSRPTPLSAWSRLQLRWLSVNVIKQAGQALLPVIPWSKILRNLLILSILSALLILMLEKLKVLPSIKPVLIPLIFISTILFSTCGEKDTLEIETLVDIETSYEAQILEITPDEYILMENKVRKDETWTEYLPGSGLMMYHIDDSLIAARFGSNDINNYSLNSQLGVRVIEADGGNELLNADDGDYGSPSDIFSKRNRHALTSYKTNDGTDAGFEISNISAEGSSMSYNLFISAE